MSTAPTRLLLYQIRKLTKVQKEHEAGDGYWLKRCNECDANKPFALQPVPSRSVSTSAFVLESMLWRTKAWHLLPFLKLGH